MSYATIAQYLLSIKKQQAYYVTPITCLCLVSTQDPNRGQEMSKTTEVINGCEPWAVTDSAALADHAEEGSKTYKAQHTRWSSKCGNPKLVEYFPDLICGSVSSFWVSCRRPEVWDFLPVVWLLCALSSGQVSPPAEIQLLLRKKKYRPQVLLRYCISSALSNHGCSLPLFWHFLPFCSLPRPWSSDLALSMLVCRCSM